MNSQEIDQLLSAHIVAGDFPSAVYIVAERGETRLKNALGNAVVTPEMISAETRTIYDLASLTKPLVTGLLAAMLIETKRLAPEDCVGGISGPTVRSLLTHTSGKPAWIPLYLLTADRESVFDFLMSIDVSEDRDVVYSDLNFILLGLFLEGIYRERLDALFERYVAAPLGLGAASFAGDIESRTSVAASETGNEYERAMCVDMGYLSEGSFPRQAFREDVIWGEVHDGNAYFMSGVAGNAGLFSTAEAVLELALQFLPKYTKLLRPETCDLFTTNFTNGLNEHRSFSFQLASTSDSTAGTRMSRESFGHNGFTGTSLWIDPVKDRIFILLTNRTHNHPLPFANINSVRREFHDTAVRLLDSDM